jgi:hypothetical protein
MACEDCGEQRPVMVPMQPGPDGKPWEFCSKCWREGSAPMRLRSVKVTEIADPHLYKALAAYAKRTARLTDRTPEQTSSNRALPL